MSYIIGHRGVTPERNDNLVAVVEFLKKHLPELEIIVVEQDKTTSDLDIFSSVKYIFLPNDGLYNRSWGFNVGIKHATNNIVAFADNDLLVPPQALTDSWQTCHYCDTVSPYNSKKVMDLSPEDTKIFISTKMLPHNPRGQYRPGCNYAGGIVIMKKQAFNKVGGWEERMQGWGGEDSHMLLKLQKLNIGRAELLQYSATHLYHERGARPYQNNPRHQDNVRLCYALKEMTPEAISKMCQRQLPLIGNNAKPQTKD